MALCGAMTIGAFALMLMETEPLRPPAAALEAVREDPFGVRRAMQSTYRGFDRIKWRKVVVHSSAGGTVGVARRCHFLVGLDAGGKPIIMPTDLWRQQTEGNHVYVPGHNFDEISIGVCLLGDFSRQPPVQGQYRALVTLVRELQREFGIRPDHVYLLSHLDPTKDSPGAAFPAEDFSRRLLKN